MQVSSRHHLRSDVLRDLETVFREGFGIELDEGSYEFVELDDPELDLVLVDGEPLIAYFDGDPAPTVRGANAFEPTRGVVTVDAGAVSFVSDGADVMRPGIVEADEGIGPDDLVVIVEETHGKALAIGRTRVDAGDLTGNEGKVIDSLHHVGDDLYGLSP